MSTSRYSGSRIPTSRIPTEILLSEARRRAGAETRPSDRVLSGLFPAQLAFARDPAKRKAALCSRRAGKTTTDIRGLLAAALDYPESICAYIGLDRRSAKRNFWRPFKRYCARSGLDVKLNESELSADFQNGSHVIVGGANDEDDIEKYRGVAIRRAILDECASFRPHIETLIDDVLSPATMDVDGDIWMTGTPSALCAGIFHDATCGVQPGWATHRWTFRDNVFLPGATEWVERERERRGWGLDHPTYRREYCAEWVRDDSAVLYHFDDARNFFTDLPAPDGDRRWILAVDLGWEDATTFVLACYDSGSPVLWVTHAEEQQHWIPSRIAERIVELRSRLPNSALVMDCGALGKSIAEEFKSRYRLPVVAADKTDKMAFVRMVNDDLELGRVRISRDCGSLVAEMRLLQRGADGKEDARSKNNLCDGLLYAHRYAKPHLGRPNPRILPLTSDQEAARIEKLRVASIKRSRDDWMSYGDY